jgi:hypothetical protein
MAASISWSEHRLELALDLDALVVLERDLGPQAELEGVAEVGALEDLISSRLTRWKPTTLSWFSLTACS